MKVYLLQIRFSTHKVGTSSFITCIAEGNVQLSSFVLTNVLTSYLSPVNIS